MNMVSKKMFKMISDWACKLRQLSITLPRCCTSIGNQLVSPKIIICVMQLIERHMHSGRVAAREPFDEYLDIVKRQMIHRYNHQSRSGCSGLDRYHEFRRLLSTQFEENLCNAGDPNSKGRTDSSGTSCHSFTSVQNISCGLCKGRNFPAGSIYRAFCLMGYSCPFGLNNVFHIALLVEHAAFMLFLTSVEEFKTRLAFVQAVLVSLNATLEPGA